MKLVKINNYIFLFVMSFITVSISYSSDKSITESIESFTTNFQSESVFQDDHPHWKEWRKVSKEWEKVSKSQTIHNNRYLKTSESQNFLINILLRFPLLPDEKKQLKSLSTFIHHEPAMVNIVLDKYESKYYKELQHYFNQYPCVQEQINNHK